MKTEIIQPGPALRPYVSSIVVLQNETEHTTDLPFYADGCPGILFAQTARSIVVSPHNKTIGPLILYGQTVHPIQLHIKGPYRLIVFSLYPYIVKPFFDLDPEDITDNCFDLQGKTGGLSKALIETKSAAEQISLVQNLLLDLSQTNAPGINAGIRSAIHAIVDANGNSPMKNIYAALHMTERTFERQFAANIGISPKLFAQIVKFQSALQQLSHTDKTAFSDIVYKNGLADQSHFIRTFKKFAGKTPGSFRKNTAG